MSLAIHLELDVLDHFASGKLDLPTRHSAQLHLDSCESCRARLDELALDLQLAAELRAATPRSAEGSAPIAEPFDGFRIVREIGRGGMGIVFEAEQDNPRRRVAIKVLGLGFHAGPEVERMLHREAQALARLEHPFVARIYGLGRLRDGRPYLAMELVDGPTLTRYVAQRSLSRRERLRLFCELCDAVAYAHQRGVIHRDLKPSNVLVDRSGRPRVLDFGLARLFDVEGEASISRSIDTGHIRGTLAYMSPEQARGDEASIDVRSDVYALGMILYSLLLDRLPYEIPSGNLPEAVRVICEQAPARLSEHDRSLRGDLETIVRRALEKDPGQRYATAAALREDVLRFLERQPILARSPSLVYQLGKLVQRHTFFFAMVTGAFVAAIAVGIWMSALYGTADAQRELATRNAAEKQLEATRARSMIELLQRMLGSANVHEAKGADYTVRELLDEFAGDFGTPLHDQPDIEADLRVTIARAYSSLGLSKQALGQIESARALYGRAAIRDESKLVELLELDAACAHDEARYEDAEREYRVLLSERVRLVGAGHDDVARAQYALGDVLRHRGDGAGAEELVRASLAIRRAPANEDDVKLLPNLSLLAQILQDRGELAEAKLLMLEALETSTRVNGERHRNTASLENNLGAVCLEQGDLDAADLYFQRALATQRALVRGDHPEIARALNNLGEVRRNQGRYADAVVLLREGFEMRERLLAPGHPDLAQSLNNLGLALQSSGDLTGSIDCLRKAVAVRRAALGEDLQLSNTLTNLAQLLRLDGKLDESIALCREALELQEAHPSEQAYMPSTLIALGKGLRDKGELAEAKSAFERALEIRLRSFAEHSVKVAECRMFVGSTLLAQGKGVEAEASLRASVEDFIAAVGEDHQHVALARTELGICLRVVRRFEEAEVVLLAAHRAYEAKYGAKDARSMRAARALSVVYGELDRKEEQERWSAGRGALSEVERGARVKKGRDEGPARILRLAVDIAATTAA